MVSIAVIGLGNFGCRVLDELIDSEADIIIIDRDREIVEKYKERVRDAYITDAINQEALKKMIPDDIDSVVVDLGGQLESSILVTNYLHKLGVRRIIVKAKSDEQGEILKLVGATLVILPDLDAAQRIAPLLMSSVLFNFMQISEGFALAEISVLPEMVGKSLVNINFRQHYRTNIVAWRRGRQTDVSFVDSPDFVVEEGMSLLAAGTDGAIHSYVEKKVEAVSHNKKLFSIFFHHR